VTVAKDFSAEDMYSKVYNMLMKLPLLQPCSFLCYVQKLCLKTILVKEEVVA